MSCPEYPLASPVPYLHLLRQTRISQEDSLVPSPVNPYYYWEAGVRLKQPRGVHTTHNTRYEPCDHCEQAYFRKRQSSSWDTALRSRDDELR